MYRYVFIHDDVDTYIIRAKNQRNAIKSFKVKVDGRAPFFKGLKLSDIKHDISEGSILLYRAKRGV